MSYKSVNGKSQIRVKSNSVADIAKLGLCCSCGACAWACPQKAISYVETVSGNILPLINTAECTECGICLSVCPAVCLGSSVIERLPHDPFTGNALQTYVGKATDKELYANSQSGGIVSALLTHALESGKIAGAATVVMVAGNPPRATATLAKSTAEIRQAQKSKYCPVPLLSILDEFKELEGPIAIVGVACQIHALCNILEQYPQFKEKVSFTVGLICERVMTYGAIDFLLKKTNLSKKKKVTMLHFRDKACGGYPGNVNVIYSDGYSVSLPASARMQIKDFFTPACCRLCFDMMNVFSDITVGDPWGIDGVDRIGGESAVILRTETGRSVFQNALKDSAVTAREISYNEVLVGQKIEHKKSQWYGYVEAWKKSGRPLPNYWELVCRCSSTQHRNDYYQSSLRHALSLDKYPSRAAIVAAVEKKLFFQKIKRKATLPFRAMKRLLGRISKNII